MVEYTYQCKQANGTIYQPKMRGFNRMQAASMMRDAKKAFCRCTDWKLVRIGERKP